MIHLVNTQSCKIKWLYLIFYFRMEELWGTLRSQKVAVRHVSYIYYFYLSCIVCHWLKSNSFQSSCLILPPPQFTPVHHFLYKYSLQDFMHPVKKRNGRERNEQSPGYFIRKNNATTTSNHQTKWDSTAWFCTG